MCFFSSLCGNAIFHYPLNGIPLETEMGAEMPLLQMARHVLTNTQQRPPWEPRGTSPSSSPTMKLAASSPWKMWLLSAHPFLPPSVLCWGFCGLLLLFLPSSPTKALLKKKCQDKQNESLGDPVMGTERECGHHSTDLCSDMFSICFHTECTFSPWISNNLNQDKTITKWRSNTTVSVGTEWLIRHLNMETRNLGELC